MKNKFLLFLSLLISSNLICQSSLKHILDSSEVDYDNIYFFDNKGNTYQRELNIGVAYYVVFSSVELINKKQRIFLIQGHTLLAFSKKIKGVGDINLFLGRVKEDTINNIRILSKSSLPEDSGSKQYEGFFSFKASISKDDKLFFSSYGGGGLREFNIGRIVAIKNENP